jgi:hypothetical protein
MGQAKCWENGERRACSQAGDVRGVGNVPCVESGVAAGQTKNSNILDSLWPGKPTSRNLS